MVSGRSGPERRADYGETWSAVEVGQNVGLITAKHGQRSKWARTSGSLRRNIVSGRSGPERRADYSET